MKSIIIHLSEDKLHDVGEISELLLGWKGRSLSDLDAQAAGWGQ